MPSHTVQEGFTLIEILVTLGISMIVLSLLVATFVFMNRSYNRQVQVAETQGNVRTSMDIMTREITMAAYIPEAPGNAPTTDVSGEGFTNGVSEDFDEADAFAITFEADIDNDDRTETVRFSWSGTAGDPLKREMWEWDSSTSAWGSSGGARVLVENIQGLSFAYFDGSDMELSRPLNSAERPRVRRIRIQLEARSDKADQSGYAERVLSSDVVPRNLAGDLSSQ